MAVLSSLALVIFALVMLRKSTTMRLGSVVFAFTIAAALLLLIGYYLIDSFTGSGIDESVLFLLNTGFEGALLRDFWSAIALGLLLVTAALSISIYAYRTVRTAAISWKSRLRLLLGACVLAAGFYINPAVIDIFALVSAERGALNAKTDMGETPENYVRADNLSFENERKNLVILYLESIERTFLDQTLFPGLMPNLTALEKEGLSFTDIDEVDGTTWTIAGMIASQCGIPLSGSSGAGSDLFLPGTSCIGDLLGDAGYDLTYLAGTPLDFAGEGSFYRSHGFQSIQGRDELLPTLEDPEYRSFWGLHDDSLLAEASHRYDRLSSGEAPFGLVALTIDTHHPSGAHIPKSCDNLVYQNGENAFLNSVLCADKLAAEFIHHIRSSPSFQDTILVVVSDHMSRPNQATDILEKGERRNLFLVFGTDVQPGENSKPGNTLDIAPTLLSLLGANTEALAYGRNLLGPTPTLRSGAIPVDQILRDDRPFLSSLWSYPQLDEGMVMDFAQNRLILGDRFVEFPVLFQLNEQHEIVSIAYEIDGEEPLESGMSYLSFDQRFVWIDHCRKTAIFDYGSFSDSGQYCALIGSLGSSDTGSIRLVEGHKIEFEDVQSYFDGAHSRQEIFDFHISEWQQNVQFADTTVVEFLPPTGLVGQVSVRSAGYPVTGSWVLNRETGERVELLRGLTLIGLNAGEAPVKIAHKDTCAYGREVFDLNLRLERDLMSQIEQNRSLFGAMIIVADSSAVCYEIDPHLSEIFEGSDFTKWSDLWYNQPYVAVVSGNGNIQEFIGEPNTAIGIDLNNFIQPVLQNSQH